MKNLILLCSLFSVMVAATETTAPSGSFGLVALEPLLKGENDVRQALKKTAVQLNIMQAALSELSVNLASFDAGCADSLCQVRAVMTAQDAQQVTKQERATLEQLTADMLNANSAVATTENLGKWFLTKRKELGQARLSVADLYGTAVPTLTNNQQSFLRRMALSFLLTRGNTAVDKATADYLADTTQPLLQTYGKEEGLVDLSAIKATYNSTTKWLKCMLDEARKELNAETIRFAQQCADEQGAEYVELAKQVGSDGSHKKTVNCFLSYKILLNKLKHTGIPLVVNLLELCPHNKLVSATESYCYQGDTLKPQGAQQGTVCIKTRGIRFPGSRQQFLQALPAAWQQENTVTPTYCTDPACNQQLQEYLNALPMEQVVLANAGYYESFGKPTDWSVAPGLSQERQQVCTAYPGTELNNMSTMCIYHTYADRV